MSYTCVHCSKTFTKESTLVAHMCEQKRRALQKDEKRVQAGYMVYNRFYRLTNPGNHQDKSYEHFAKSSYYSAFVKFGSFVNNVNPLYPDKFIDFVIKSGVKLDHWCRDELYDTYLDEMLKVEPVDSAIERTLNTMNEWAEEQKSNFAHYFSYVNLNRAVTHISNGLISSWVVLNSTEGIKMLANFSDEQLAIIESKIDPVFWKDKFRKQPSDVELVKEVCKEIGI